LAFLSLIVVLWRHAPVHAQPRGESKVAPDAANSSEDRGLVPMTGEINVAVTYGYERDPAVAMCAWGSTWQCL
jgi:hypothetical protein